MNYLWLTSFILLSLNMTANACLWEKSDPAYWPSSTIPVCFTNGSSDPEIQNVMRIIRNAFTQLNQKTDFTFQGFTDCSQISSTRAAIRIKLADASIGRAYSIGPSSALSPVNMDLPKNSYDNQSHPIAINESFLAGTAIHEAMHLLGFHHGGAADSHGVRKAFQDNPNLLVNGDFDPNSIMNLETHLLSDSDIRCLNLVAQRSFVGNREILPLGSGEQPRTTQQGPKKVLTPSTPTISK